MIPAWATTMIASAIGAYIAAWAGAQLGFRRSKKERALDREIAWHEDAIQALAQYEERLERLRAHALNAIVIQRSRGRPSGAPPIGPDDIPKLVKAPGVLWSELASAEARARGALRLGDLYTQGKTQLDCSVALKGSVNMVASQWMDITAEPEIPWADLQSKAMAAGNVRRSLQDSLKLVLEIDGLLAAVLGPRFRRWRTLRRFAKLQVEIAPRAT